MSLPSRLLGANPSIQVSTLLSGTLTTPSAKGAFVDTSFESIATYAINSTTSTITFSSIPSTYKHLQLRVFGKTTAATGNADAFVFNFNSLGNVTTTTGYAHSLSGNQSTVTAEVAVQGSTPYLYYCIGRNAQFGVSVIDILDYADTNKYKTIRALGGQDANGSGVVALTSFLWQNTVAINSIKIDPNGNSFVQYSHLALYGIKG